MQNKRTNANSNEKKLYEGFRSVIKSKITLLRENKIVKTEKIGIPSLSKNTNLKWSQKQNLTPNYISNSKQKASWFNNKSVDLQFKESFNRIKKFRVKFPIKIKRQ